MSVIERQFSEFLRRPNEVIADLETHDVVLRRRGAPAVRMALADREEHQAEAILAVARMFRSLFLHPEGGQRTAAQDAFPWLTFLPLEDQTAFMAELVQVLSAAADLQNLAPLAQLLREWRATAEVHADPALAARLRQPIGEDRGPVASPRE